MSERTAWYRAPEGWGTIAYDGDRILEITLPRRRPSPPRDGQHPARVRALTGALAAYFAGETPGVALPRGLRLDWTGIDGFRAAVYRTVAAIPRGETRSYADVAAQAGNPRAARAVGRAMATNPFPIVVPCHRVVRSDGTLGGFGGGLPMKERMLGLERGARAWRGR